MNKLLTKAGIKLIKLITQIKMMLIFYKSI